MIRLGRDALICLSRIDQAERAAWFTWIHNKKKALRCNVMYSTLFYTTACILLGSLQPDLVASARQEESPGSLTDIMW